MDDWDSSPANRGDIRMLSRQIGELSNELGEILRRVEQREEETWEYRTKTYPWLRGLHDLASMIWLYMFIIVVAYAIGKWA